MTDELTTTMNIMAIFFPRLTLWWCWLKGWIPANDINFYAELFLTLFVPNVLVAIYNFSAGNTVWGVVHLVLALLRMGGETSSSRKS